MLTGSFQLGSQLGANWGRYYMQAFKTIAQRAAPAAIMCAYNALYGQPACANDVTNEVARAVWGWEGMVSILQPFSNIFQHFPTFTILFE